MSNALLYGKGIFTTLAIRSGNPLFWDKHWRRLSENAAELGIDLSKHSEGSTKDAVAERSKGVVDGRVRITFLDESCSPLWSTDNEQNTSIDIVVGELRSVPDNFRLSLSPYLVNSTSPLAGVKSCNYLEHLLAYDEAKGRRFHEAVRLNERGEVTSACMANVFWLKGDRLFTPSLGTGCLAGTTREFVSDNLSVEEVEVGIEELTDADAVFLTSAGLGVARVARFEERELAGEGHPILGLIPEIIGGQSLAR